MRFRSLARPQTPRVASDRSFPCVALRTPFSPFFRQPPPSPPSRRATAPPIARPFTGLRIEGIAGGDRLQNDGHSDDFLYGIGAGYDVQMRGAVVGVEAELSDSDNKSCFGAETTVSPRICAKAARDIYVGARVGKTVGSRALVYAKAGYTNARVKLTADDGIDRTTLARDNLDGIRLGAGAEYALFSNAYVKAEYRYSNYEQGYSRNQLVGGFGVRF